MTSRTLAATIACSAAFALAVPLASPASAAPAKKYGNCTLLNRDYPTGVGLPGAVDQVRGKTPKVTNFTRDVAVYKANRGKLDADKDGIACEKYVPGAKQTKPAKKPSKKPTKPAKKPTAPKPKISVAASTREPEVGKPMTVSGVLTGWSARTAVSIQAAQGRTWRTVASTTVRPNGRYSATVRPAAKGKTSLRAVATRSRATVTSPSVVVTAYAWSHLAAKPANVHAGARTVVGDVKRGRETWRHSWSARLTSRSASAVDVWTIGGRCKALDTTAVLPTATPRTRARLEVAGAKKAKRSVALKTATVDARSTQRLTVGIRDMQQVSLGARHLDSRKGSSSTPTLLTPRVLCWG